MEHLITNMVVSELNLTCFFKINDTYYILTSTLIHFPFPYPYPSFSLHESRPHGDHIYVDMLHERQVVMHTDWGCALPFSYEYVKPNPLPYASDVHGVQLHSYDACPHTAHHLLVWELGSTSPRRSIQRNRTKKAKIRPSMFIAVL
jgi:hypothetical protein